MWLIDADALANYANNQIVGITANDIMRFPTVDAEPVKHGRWIYGENEDGQDGVFCSECDHFVPWYYDYYDKTDDLINDNPRCPNCGTKMDGGSI